MYTKRSDIPIKNTWGVKKGRGQEEAALVGLHATKMFDITKGQEVWIHIAHRVSVTSLFIHQNFTTTIGFVTWPPFVVCNPTNAASSWPRTFFTPQVFLIGISLLFVYMYAEA